MKLAGKRGLGLALALLAIAGPSPAAQDHEHEVQSLEDVHARMKELMGKVELRLKSIDELLNEASAQGKGNASGTASAEVERVLVTTRDHARQSVEDIDEILRLSLHPHPGDPSSSGGA